MKSTVSPSNLTPEQQRALSVFVDSLKEVSKLFSATLPTYVMPTGFRCFTDFRIAKNMLRTERHWCWNQSNAKVRTVLHDGMEVTIQKLNPRKKPDSPLPRPSYKVWIISYCKFDSGKELYYVWCEKGMDTQAKPIKSENCKPSVINNKVDYNSQFSGLFSQGFIPFHTFAQQSVQSTEWKPVPFPPELSRMPMPSKPVNIPPATATKEEMPWEMRTPKISVSQGAPETSELNSPLCRKRAHSFPLEKPSKVAAYSTLLPPLFDINVEPEDDVQMDCFSDFDVREIDEFLSQVQFKDSGDTVMYDFFR